jgi:hypothetical protein
MRLDTDSFELSVRKYVPQGACSTEVASNQNAYDPTDAPARNRKQYKVYDAMWTVTVVDGSCMRRYNQPYMIYMYKSG